MTNIWRVLLIGIFCLPKINLVEVDNFNAGIRIDDIFIAAFAMIYAAHVVLAKKLSITPVERAFFLFLAIVTIGTGFNALFFDRGSVLFPLRMMEYFLFFYMGWMYFSGRSELKTLVKFLFWGNVVVAFLQLIGVLGGFTVYGYRPDVSERVIGLTGGPWELGMVLNLASSYYLIKAKNNRIRYLTFGISTFLILANGSRMSLMAQFAILLYYFVMSGDVIKAGKRIIAFVPALLLVFLFIQDSGVATRSENLANDQNIEVFTESFSNLQVSEVPPQWSTLGQLSQGDEIDASWSMRGLKWIYAFKMWLLNPANMLWGVGMGVFGNALDGGWLRLLSETGVLGFAVFALFLIRSAKADNVCKLMAAALAVNMLFIDMHMAYKAMSISIFFFGYYSKKNRVELRKSINSLPSTGIR